jgi:hypothetical protein
MKVILFAAALTLGSAALAQTGNTVDDPAQASGPRGVTQQGTDPDGQACTPAGYNQGTSGYPPCGGDMNASSAGGTAGTGMSGGGGMGGSGALPPCSRTVKDRCVQAYERGRRR